MNTKITSLRLDNNLRLRADEIVKITGLDMTTVLRFCIKSSLDVSLIASKLSFESTPEAFRTPEFDFLISAHRMKSSLED